MTASACSVSASSYCFDSGAAIPVRAGLLQDPGAVPSRSG
ncbi:hypothetical protein [Acidovorax sp. LjRoot129]